MKNERSVGVVYVCVCDLRAHEMKSKTCTFDFVRRDRFTRWASKN